jgi:hypothetical protein
MTLTTMVLVILAIVAIRTAFAAAAKRLRKPMREL